MTRSQPWRKAASCATPAYWAVCSPSTASTPSRTFPTGLPDGVFRNYPTQDVVNDIFQFMREKSVSPVYGTQYCFGDIRKACVALDSGIANGKIVIMYTCKARIHPYPNSSYPEYAQKHNQKTDSTIKVYFAEKSFKK